MYQRQVGFENLAFAKLLSEVFMRCLGLRDDNQPGGVAIQAMDYTGPGI